MITKELFVETINAMKRIYDYQNDKNKLYKKYDADGFLIEPDNNYIILKLLKLFLPDSFYDAALEDFCFANNYGRGKSNSVYQDANGQRIKISSPEELYDYIFTKEIGGDVISANTV